jgi:signal transduction histidine kinase
LSNLLDNAIKYSKEGRIVVTAEPQDNMLLISVIDQGQGILPENLERVFERFFQEKTRHFGAGLGLAICRTIVEVHGGRIWAESAGRGQGATIRFTLPTIDGDEEAA